MLRISTPDLTFHKHFNENFYCKNRLKVFSAMTGKPALGYVHTLLDSETERYKKFIGKGFCSH